MEVSETGLQDIAHPLEQDGTPFSFPFVACTLINIGLLPMSVPMSALKC